MQKIKIGHRTKFRDKENFFPQVFFRFARFYAVFSLPCVARATFDRNLIHSADECFLVMACVDYSRVEPKTVSSLLKAFCMLAFDWDGQSDSECKCRNGPTRVTCMELCLAPPNVTAPNPKLISYR